MVWTGTRGPREDGHGQWWRGDLESRCSPDETLNSGNMRYTLPKVGFSSFAVGSAKMAATGTRKPFGEVAPGHCRPPAVDRISLETVSPCTKEPR